MKKINKLKQIKNSVVFAFLVILSSQLVLSCKEKLKSNEFTITGHLEGVANGTKIALVPFAMYQQKPEIETTINEEMFSFKGSVPEPRLYFLVLGNEEDYYKIMVENSAITFKGKVEKQALSKDSPKVYKYRDISVTGSESHEYFQGEISVREKMNNLHDSIYKRYQKISLLMNEARVEKNSQKMDSIKELEEYKEYLKADSKFFKTIEESYQAVFNKNSESFWGPLMMLNLYSYFTPEARPQFEAMSADAKNSFYGKMVEEELYPANRIGEKVPDFITKGQDGKSYALNDLIKKKKIVLIDFWASWCAPCRKELPNVKANYKKYVDLGFDVISISIDKNPKAWEKALEEEQMPWPNFNDNDVASLYKVSSVPTTYLIDNEGKLLADNVRGEDLGIILEQLLGSK